uniref:Uncharacterized protein n=1 Tax=Anguilla anguilla TaxID=7936 RepID=A0A0E9Q0R7_ANGAN
MIQLESSFIIKMYYYLLLLKQKTSCFGSCELRKHYFGLPCLWSNTGFHRN